MSLLCLYSEKEKKLKGKKKSNQTPWYQPIDGDWMSYWIIKRPVWITSIAYENSDAQYLWYTAVYRNQIHKELWTVVIE